MTNPYLLNKMKILCHPSCNLYVCRVFNTHKDIVVLDSFRFHWHLLESHSLVGWHLLLVLDGTINGMNKEYNQYEKH